VNFFDKAVENEILKGRRLELQVITMNPGMSVCPFFYFDSTLRGIYEQKVLQLISDWEQFKGDPSVYNEKEY